MNSVRLLFEFALVGNENAICCIVTHATSEDAPYKIMFSGYPVKRWEVLEGDEWKMTEGNHGRVTWDRTFTTSSQSILGHRLIPRAAGGWWLEYIEPEMPEITEPESPEMPTE